MPAGCAALGSGGRVRSRRSRSTCGPRRTSGRPDMTRPSTLLACPMLAALALTGAPAATARAEGECTPSRHGPKDQAGNVNYITPAKTLAASRLITRGKAYRLGIETNRNTPAYPPRTFSITVVQPGQAQGATIG